MKIKAIIEYLDSYLKRSGRPSLDPVEANEILAKAGLLRDSKERPGKPLRDMLRKGQLPHAFQSGGKGSGWTIPHSSKPIANNSNYPTLIHRTNKPGAVTRTIKTSGAINFSELKTKLESARLKYKPNIVKYLLIAEAPPDSLERFFYYNEVHQHDYLFLGVVQALYPDLKNKFLASGRNSDIKNSILLKFKSEGFYLLDLSELPLSFMVGDLSTQLMTLIDKIRKVADEKTKIILIKATVYDTAFRYLQREGFDSVVNIRIPFPGQGGQKLFHTKFGAALKLIGYK